MKKLNTNPTVKSRNSTSPERDYAKTSILKANSLNKSRNANEVLLTHLEKKRGHTLSTEEQKIALYFAYQSDHHFRNYLVENSNDTQIGFNYTSDINAFYRSLSPQHKDFFDEVKSYFAEQAAQFFIQNGWLNTSTDAVADLFSGVDYSFARYLNSKYNMNVCAIDTAFDHSDINNSKNINLLNINILLSSISEQSLSKIKEKDFIYISAPILPRKIGKKNQRVFCKKQYNVFIDNLKKLSKDGAHIAICMHVNNAQENNHLFNKFCQELSLDPQFEYRIITHEDTDTTLISQQFETIIYLKVKKRLNDLSLFCMPCAD